VKFIGHSVGLTFLPAGLPVTFLVSAGASQIATEITNVPVAITSINPEFPLTAIDLARVGSNLSSISTKFFWTGSFATVLTKFAHIAASFDHVTVDVATIASDFPVIRANFSAIGTKLTTLPWTDVPTLSRHNSRRNKKSCQ
jgi:hypothetical protein